MSSLEEELTRQQMEESGELDFIRQIVAAQKQEGAAPTAPVEPTETAAVEPETIEAEEPPVTETEETPEAREEVEEPAAQEEDDTLYLELDEETEALLNAKYGGDLNKALGALREGQSLIGRQGNELGELRKELAELRGEFRQGMLHAQPYPDWPDEDFEPAEAVSQFRMIADEAFQRGDQSRFSEAMNAWSTLDPVGSETFATLKVMQAQLARQQEAPVVREPEPDITQKVEELKAKYPDLQKPEIMEAISAEMQKRPTLGRLLQTDATVQERVQALEDLYLLVASRTVSETERQARRRVAIRTSEEARQARQAAQVAVATSNRGSAAEEPEERKAPLGTTGRSLDLNRLNAMLDPSDRI